MTNVKLVRVPGGVSNLNVEGDNPAVNDALINAGIELDGREVRVNGKVVPESHTLAEGDTIMLLQSIKGNV